MQTDDRVDPTEDPKVTVDPAAQDVDRMQIEDRADRLAQQIDWKNPTEPQLEAVVEVHSVEADLVRPAVEAAIPDRHEELKVVEPRGHAVRTWIATPINPRKNRTQRNPGRIPPSRQPL